MTIATIEPAAPTPTGDLARWAVIASAAANLADRIAGTDFVPEAMRGNPAMVTAAIMYGDELGIGPMQALAGINVIRGKPSPSSELMRALVYRAGHSMRVLMSTGERCRIAGQRKGEREPTVIEWDIAMARAAGLLDGNPTWRRYPRAMLLARATSELCRVMFPDVVKGLGHVADDDATADEWDAWAATDTGTEHEPARRTATVARAPRPTDDVPLPGDTVPSRKAMSEAQFGREPEAEPEPPRGAERLDEWPADTWQPPLPEMPPESHQGPVVGGVPPLADEAPPPSRPGQPPTTPEPLPVPDDNEPAQEHEPIGPRTRAVLMALFDDLGIPPTAERAKRIAITRAIVGRPIESTNDLTRREGLAVVRVLNEIATGGARIEIDPSAPYGVTITTERQEP